MVMETPRARRTAPPWTPIRTAPDRIAGKPALRPIRRENDAPGPRRRRDPAAVLVLTRREIGRRQSAADPAGQKKSSGTIKNLDGSAV